MNIAIIGGGITGLTAAYELTKQGHHVEVFERDHQLGGLAIGWREPGWDWSLEKAYHHLFTNDYAILSLVKELGIEDKLIVKRPITANYVSSSSITGPARAGDNTNVFQLDSPSHLFSFPGLSLIDKLRTAALVAFCKINPFWQPLESITAQQLFMTVGGKNAWKILWEPLMVGKFSDYSSTISAAWLWARIKKRTPNLIYIEGGFETFINALAKAIKKQGGVIHTNINVPPIVRDHSSFQLLGSKFDSVLLTVPTPIVAKIFPQLLTTNYLLQPLKIPHLHAQVLVLETKEPILKDVYWLNITDRNFPFLAVVAHTNFMDKKHYSNRYLTYIGNYLPDNHPFLKLSKEALFKKFLPYLKKLLPATTYKLQPTNSYLFTAPFAQPVHQLHYSHRAPKITTGIPNVYLANMDSIYPWDRGTNYAVELGQKAARVLCHSGP